MAKKAAKDKAKKRFQDRYRHVVLRLYAKDLDPDKITRTLGLTPSDSWNRGPIKGKSSIIYKYYGQWNLKARLRGNATLENQIKDILDQIKPKRKRLQEVLKEVKAELNIAVEPHKDLTVVGYTFPAGLLNEFTSIGIDIHLSFHNPQLWGECTASNKKKAEKIAR